MGEEKINFEAAIKRRFKKPFSFFAVAISPTPILTPGPGGKAVPKVRMEMRRFEIETVGDLASFQQGLEGGLLKPIPDLAIQVLNLLAEREGWLEDE